MDSDVEIVEAADDMENEQSGVSTSSDWEMDEEHSEQWSEADSMDKESTYLIPRTLSPPKPSCSSRADKPEATSADAPSNAGGELTPKPMVTSAI